MKPIAKLTKAERAAILRDPNARLSDLLEIAALDAIALQKQKRVKFDMSTWVSPRGNKCDVCLAGASLFRTLDKRVWVGSPEHAGAGRFAAVNFYRINAARLGDLYRENPEVREMVKAALACVQESFSVSLNRAPFRVYLKAARKLRESGL